MFVISTVLYAALTIIFVPALIVLVYMMITNGKYSGVVNIYGISGSGIGGLFILGFIGYIFLAGLCIGELPVIWGNVIFLLVFGCSIAIALIICKILSFMNGDRIKYAKIVMADEEIQDKIIECSKQLEEMQRTIGNASYNPDAKVINQQRIQGLRDTINKMAQIHNELQEQKIVLNAAIGASGMKNVSLSDGISVTKSLDRELDKFSANRSINSSFRGVENIMKKYSI